MAGIYHRDTEARRKAGFEQEVTEATEGVAGMRLGSGGDGSPEDDPAFPLSRWPFFHHTPPNDLFGSQRHDADCPGGPGGDVAVSDRGMGQPVQQLPVWVLAHAGD